jgi:hypothetical protein
MTSQPSVLNKLQFAYDLVVDSLREAPQLYDLCITHISKYNLLALK